MSFEAISTDSNYNDATLDKLEALAKQGVYMVPLTANYTMRMQSNPYKQSLEVK